MEGDRRNFGITKCSYEWILEIDADEIISKELAKEIKIKINQKRYDYFYINLINYVYNKKIVGGWMACLAPDGKFCLFRRKIKYGVTKKYILIIVFLEKKGKEFKNSIDHMMSKNLSELICRFNRNTSLHAEDLFDQEANLKKSFSIRKIFQDL